MSNQDQAEHGQAYRDVSEIIDKVADKLTPSELSLLQWATGTANCTPRPQTTEEPSWH